MLKTIALNKLLIGVLLFTLHSLFGQIKLKDTIAKMPLGSKISLQIVFTDSLNNTTSLPVLVFKGQRPGTCLTILAGVHGAEYAPIIAGQQFIQQIEVAKLTGTIILLPVANTGAFYKRSVYVNPLDGVNLNNAFPGKSNSTVTNQIAHYITHEIIPQTNVFLDMHGGDANEDLLPFVCYYQHNLKPVQTAEAKRLSLASGFKTVVSYPYTIKDSEPAKYAFKQAVQNGKVGLSFEAGKMGMVTPKAVQLHLKGMFNILNALQMYTSPATKLLQPKFYNNQVYVKAQNTGILYSAVRAGDIVTKGQQLGYITSLDGKVLHQIKAGATGLVLYKVATPPVTKSETLFCIAITN